MKREAIWHSGSKSIFTLFFLLILNSVAYSANYYVSVSGNNANSGTSIRNAWQTITYAYSTWPLQAGHNYSAGDTIFVAPGTYEGIYINDTKCFINNIVITAYDTNNKPTFLPNKDYCVCFSEYREDTSTQHHYDIHDITIQNIIMDGAASNAGYGIKLVGDSVHNIRIINCEVKNCAESGIASAGPGGVKFVAPHNNLFKGLRVHDNGGINVGNHGFYIGSYGDTIENCLVYYNSGHGIKIGTTICDNLPASNITIRNNICCFNGLKSGGPRAGISVTGCNYGLVSNNICYGNVIGIILDIGAKNINVFNNTCYNNILHGMALFADGCGPDVKNTPTTNDSVVNNINYRNSDTAIDHNGIFIDPLDVPLFISKNDSGKNNIDPGFHDPASGNFILTNNSYALHSGFHLSSVTTDIYGHPRPKGNYDLGAIEGSVSSALIRTKFYVDSAIGSDLNAGTEAAPYKSVTRGMSELFPGDTLVAGNGSYIEYYNTAIPYGTPNANIVLMAKPGTTPVLRARLYRSNSVFPVESPYRSFGSAPQYITIIGLTFDAGDYPAATVGSPFSVGTKGIVINNCVFRNANRNFIDINAGAKGVTFNNCSFQRSNSTQGTVRVMADGAVFNNCIWYGNDSGDNVYMGGRNGKFDNCTILNASGNGIVLANNARANTISNSKIYGNGSNGIRIDAPKTMVTNNAIINNTIYSNDSSGISANSRADTIRENTVYKNKVHGIYGNNFYRSYVEKNKIDSNGQNGIYLNTGDIFTGYNNMIYGNAANGIEVNAIDSVKVYNNTIADNKGTGVAARSTSSKVDLTNNIIYGNKAADTAVHGQVSNFSSNWLTSSGDPKFAGRGNYSLSGSSPCINRGKPVPAAMARELQAMPKAQLSQSNIGADEIKPAH